VRASGNDAALVELAKKNALALSAGHSFIVILGAGFFPINVLHAIKNVPEVVNIYCATANPVEVILAETDWAGILGVLSA
jgi:adenosine/AMP kinase